jgi:hypothetical protein
VENPGRRSVIAYFLLLMLLGPAAHPKKRPLGFASKDEPQNLKGTSHGRTSARNSP